MSWTDASALWQVEHGKLSSARTRSAAEHLWETADSIGTGPMVSDLLDIITRLRGGTTESNELEEGHALDSA